PGIPVPDTRARVRRMAGDALIGLLVALAAGVFATAIVPHGPSSTLTPFAPATPGAQTVATAVSYAHALGAGAGPGRYTLTELADPGGLNLARRLADGEQLRVPALGETPVAGAGGVALVNLNTADAGALESLPRIGPALARRILAWRESHGGFSSVEDLLA